MKKIEIIAHRGGYGPHKENTLKTFIHNIKSGTKAFEMDIRFDYWNRRFFLVHSFIHRSYWRRNLLVDIIPEIPKDVFLLIELKTNSAFTNIFVNNFRQVYDGYLKGRKIIVISYNPFVLMRLRKIAPEIPRGMMCGNRIWNFLYHRFFFKFVDAGTYIFNKRYLNDKYLRFAKKRNMRLITYLINSKKGWNKALKFDVDGVITDSPKVLKRFYESRAVAERRLPVRPLSRTKIKHER